MFWFPSLRASSGVCLLPPHCSLPTFPQVFFVLLGPSLGHVFCPSFCALSWVQCETKQRWAFTEEELATAHYPPEKPHKLPRTTTLPLDSQSKVNKRFNKSLNKRP